MSKEINGKIIRILDNKSIIIDLGKKDGINYNDSFEIYEPGEEIEDYTNGEKLGRLDFIKATVKPTIIKEKFSVMDFRTVREQENSINPLSAFSTKTETRKITTIHDLNVNEHQINPLKIKNKKISINDKVRLKN